MELRGLQRKQLAGIGLVCLSAQTWEEAGVEPASGVAHVAVDLLALATVRRECPSFKIAQAQLFH